MTPITSSSNGRAPIMTESVVARAMLRHEQARAAGLRLAWMRETAGVSRADLAAYVGVSPRTLGRVEAGERVMRPRERILAAKALGGSLATFIVSSSNGNGSSTS